MANRNIINYGILRLKSLLRMCIGFFVLYLLLNNDNYNINNNLFDLEVYFFT